ncbi:MAG: putative transcriptional regulator [Bacteriovoracaceae bacterium]|jgi:predicted transcriptional regulator
MEESRIRNLNHTKKLITEGKLKESLFMPLKVHDVMSQEEIKIYQDDELETAERIMDWEGLKHVCVFDHNDELVGVLNYENVKKEKKLHLRVRYLMHTDFHRIYGQLDAQEGLKAVINEPDHCMPVIENQKIIGILSVEDFYFASDFN